MLKNKLIVLAFAGIILAGTIIGSASAATWSPGLDDSINPVGENTYWKSGYSPSNQNTPSVPAGNYATWVNNMKNDCPYYRYPCISWSDSFGQSGQIASETSISGYGGKYSPMESGSVYASSSYIGMTDSVYVTHWYTATYLGDGPHVSGTQRFTITS